MTTKGARANPQLKVRMSAQLRERVTKEADAAVRSLNSEVVSRLSERYEQLDRARSAAGFDAEEAHRQKEQTDAACRAAGIASRLGMSTI